MSFGIPEKTMSLIISALKQNTVIERAAIFGSRSVGNYKNGSDIDIVIYGNNVTAETVNQLSIQLNEKLPIPYYVDVVHYESLNHKPLKDHINKYGKVIYIK
ncbi:MAG: nucleotidyltransferase domain-containing protein [Thermoanaerobacterales bacterium]|jgi:predicted nucleotidyltransferase|nr:nucleotidyltransferase domain-containing protein [Thermoanaerobacterales bacterium]